MAADLLAAMTPMLARVEPTLASPLEIAAGLPALAEEMNIARTHALEMVASNHVICSSTIAAMKDLDQAIEDWKASNEQGWFNVTIERLAHLRDACKLSLSSAMAVLREWDANFLAFHRLEMFADPNRWNAVRD